MTDFLRDPGLKVIMNLPKEALQQAWQSGFVAGLGWGVVAGILLVFLYNSLRGD